MNIQCLKENCIFMGVALKKHCRISCSNYFANTIRLKLLEAFLKFFLLRIQYAYKAEFCLKYIQ